MNYGFYLAASGVLTAMHRQDVLANNLANVNTVAFQPDMVVQQARLPERLEDAHHAADPQWLLEQLGGGTLIDPTQVGRGQGALKATGSSLDVALQGDGYLVYSNDHEAGMNSWRLSRDGRLERREDGTLVNAGNGMPILDVNGSPITLAADGNVQINADGTLLVDGVATAQLKLADARDPREIIKLGGNLMKLKTVHEQSFIDARAVLKQGHLEQSRVDPVLALNAMVSASKAAQGSAKMMQYHDFLMQQSINTFGRVA